MGSTVRSTEAVVLLLVWASDSFVMVYPLLICLGGGCTWRRRYEAFVVQMTSLRLSHPKVDETSR